MASVYHWSNDLNEFIAFYGIEETNPGAHGFNGNLVRHAVYVGFVNGESHRAQLTDDAWGGAARDQLRWQFAHTHTANANGAFADLGGKFVTFTDIAGGRELFRVKNLSAGNNPTNFCQAQYWDGAAWVNVGLSFEMPSVYATLTVTIKIADVGGVFQVHVNGALMASLLGDTKFTASTTIDTIQHYCWGTSGLGVYEQWYAEHMLADYDFPTYGLHVTDLDITGVGTNGTQVAGTFADVNEYPGNTGSAMSFTAAGQKFSGALRNLDASLATTSIMGVRVSALARKGATGPQTMKFGLQQAGWLTSPARTVNGVGYTPIAYSWLLNPATGAPFTPAQINAATFEPGVEAAA
jgi:hypothetical protein